MQINDLSSHTYAAPSLVEKTIQSEQSLFESHAYFYSLNFLNFLTDDDRVLFRYLFPCISLVVVSAVMFVWVPV